jgi:hypothetical protein
VESPKKAANAAVFGLPLKPLKDVDLRVKARRFGPVNGLQGLVSLKRMPGRYRPQADRIEKGQGL